MSDTSHYRGTGSFISREIFDERKIMKMSYRAGMTFSDFSFPQPKFD